MRALVDEVATLLTTSLGEAWTGYKHAVRDSPTYPYWWVYSNTGLAESMDLADSRNLRGVTVWVACVAAGPKDSPDAAQMAGQQAAWGAEKAQNALVTWRPSGVSWRPVHLTSQPPQRDEDKPESTVVFTVDTYGISRQI